MFRPVILMFTCFLILSGCSKSGDDALVAKWEFGRREGAVNDLGDSGDGIPKTIVFSQSGDVSWDGQSRTWSWVRKGNTNTIIVTHGPRSYTFNITFWGRDAGAMTISNAAQERGGVTYWRK